MFTRHQVPFLGVLKLPELRTRLPSVLTIPATSRISTDHVVQRESSYSGSTGENPD
jgi:hypothetical protein